MEIVERDITGVKVEPPRAIATASDQSSGFPRVFSLQEDLRVELDGERKKVSLFALSQQTKLVSLKQSHNVECHSGCRSYKSASTSPSTRVLSPKDEAQIAEENARKLADMSHEQILQSQQELTESLDPKLLEFLRKRRRNKNECVNLSESNAQIPVSDKSALQVVSGDERVRFEDQVGSSAPCGLGTDSPIGLANCSMGVANGSMGVADLQMGVVTNEVGGVDNMKGVVPSDVGGANTSTSVTSSEVGVVLSAVEASSQTADDSTTATATQDSRVSAAHSATAPARLQNILDYEDLPIDPSRAAACWLHMDRVEVDKMQWMSRAPRPPRVTRCHGDQHAARFDFHGALLPADAAPPVHTALYHHGEEAGRAGYTVAELYTLARSSVQQQRTIALDTLANILLQNALGVFDDAISPPLLVQLLDSDVMFLARFAVDDSSPGVVTAALRALVALVCSGPDEACVDRVWSWPGGDILPLLSPATHTLCLDSCSDVTHPDQLSDQQLSRDDALLALVRTDLFPRLRYILEVVRPGAEAVAACLRLLCRCAQHSQHVATQLLHCPRLLHVLFTEFLPAQPPQLAARADAISCLYGVPTHQLLKLLRQLAAHGQQLSCQLLKAWPQLPDTLLAYISFDPSECGLPLSESLKLATESCRLWHTLLQSHVTHHHFVVFYPLLMRQLQYFAGAVDICGADAVSWRFCHDLAACLLRVCTCMIQQATSAAAAVQKTADFGSSVEWHQVAGLFDPVMMCCTKWLTQLTRLAVGDPTANAVQAVACVMACVRSYYMGRRLLVGVGGGGDGGPLCDDSQLFSSVTSLCHSLLLPFVHSDYVKRVSSRLSEWSMLLFATYESASVRRHSPALPALGTLCWQSGGQLPPLLAPSCGTPLVTALTDLLLCLGHTCLISVPTDSLTGTLDRLTGRGVYCADAFTTLGQVSEALLDTVSVWSYLQLLAAKDQQLQQLGSWFSRHETQLLANILSLLVRHSPSLDNSERTAVIFSCASRLLSCSLYDQRHIVRRLLADILFSPRLPLFNCDADQLAALLLYLNVLLAERYCSRQEILATAVSTTVAGHCGTAQCTSATRGTLVPADWWYMPMVEAYHRLTSGDKQKSARVWEGESGGCDGASDSELAMVVCCLRTVSALAQMAPTALSTVSDIGHLSRVCLTFLIGEDLFLDADVRDQIQLVFSWLFADGKFIDLSGSVPGLSSFSDMFEELVSQFAAVSYGDWLFGALILIVLDVRQPVELRRSLLIDKAHALRSLTTRTDQLLIPVDKMCLAGERDAAVLAAYRGALAGGHITATRTPALYTIATTVCAARHGSSAHS